MWIQTGTSKAEHSAGGRGRQMTHAFLAILVQIIVHDWPTPQQGKDSPDDQERAVGDKVASRAQARDDE